MRTSITLAASACRRFVRRGAWLLLPSAIAGSAGAQVVHVVGTRDGPGVEFTSVQAAVDTAASGDVLLLLPGDHAGPVTVGKSLVLLGAPAADGSAPSLQELTIFSPAPATRVTVRGIRLASPMPTSAESHFALDIDASPGVFLFEDCVSADEPGQDARVGWSGRAVFVRCAFRGDTGKHAFGTLPESSPSPGLLTVQSTHALYDCRLTGGLGAPAKQAGLTIEHGQDGAYGAILATGMWWDWTLASRVTIEGGPGGAGSVTTTGACLGAGEGGTALYAATTFRPAAVDLVAGSPGVPSEGCSAASAGGDLDLAPNGSVEPLPRVLPRLLAPALLEPGGVANLRYEGAPGETVLLLVAGAPELMWIANAGSALAVAPDFRVLLLGTADASGALELSAPIPAGVLNGSEPGAAIVAYLQAVGIGRGFACSNPSVVTILELP